MVRISLALGCLLLLAGCMEPGQRPSWMNDAMKDARGDNMRMQGETSSPWSTGTGGRSGN